MKLIKMKRKKSMLLVCLMAGLCGAQVLAVPDANVLAAFYGCSAGENDYVASGVDGAVFLDEAFQLNVNAGSSDGTFGSTGAGASIETGAYEVRIGTAPANAPSQQVGFEIVNQTGGPLRLDSISFDYARYWADSPQTVELLYLSGDLVGTASDTIIQSASVQVPLGANKGDFDDFDGSLSGLPNRELANGGTAVFALKASDAAGIWAGGGFDNIAILGGASDAVACDTAPSSETLVGIDILNGNFDTPAGSGDINFADEPNWVNIGTGGDDSVFLKDNETFDGTRNAIISEVATRTPGLDTGYSLVDGDTFCLCYHWRDSWQWNDAADQIRLRLFVTSDDTISGTPSDLISSLSGPSTVNDTYELVYRKNLYTADAAVSGKRLFVAFDTQDGNGAADGFARLDNIELTVLTSRQPNPVVASISTDTMHLAWDSFIDNSYTIQQSTNLLSDWTSLQCLVPPTNGPQDYAASIDANAVAYFRVCKTDRFVDSSTPGDAQPNLVSSTDDTWTLDFSDEFNTFDTTKWVKSVSSSSRAARAAQGISDWWWRADHVAISNGTLALKISKPDSDTMHCGSVESKNLYETAYGFMEARINCSPIEKGAHTAFWLQGHNTSYVNDSGADGAEVDIFESAYGNGGIDPQDQECQSVLHWDGYGADTRSATRHWNAEDVYTGYHTFGLHWTPDCLDFYYDGVFIWNYDNTTHAKPGAVPQIAEWLWLSVGASFGDGNFQTETYPSYSFVDYVRVWKSN